MSEHVLNIGLTRLVIESRFGVHILSVSEHGRPVQRVGTFDTAVAASQAVEAIKRGLAEDGADWDEPRPRGTSAPDAVLESRWETWDNGHRAGWHDRTQSIMNGANGLPDPADTPNPFGTEQGAANE